MTSSTGVGTAMLGGGKKGPAAGFHIYVGDRVVAVAQIIGDKRVLLARGTGPGERAELIPAVAALLLLDETIREF